MKKIYSFFVFCLSFGLITTAQTVTPEYINMMELSRFEAAHPELYSDCKTCKRKENEAEEVGIPDLPFPAGAIIKRQAQDNLRRPATPVTPFTPSTPLAPSPPPAQSFLGHVDPGQGIPPDTHGAVGPNHIVTATNDFLIVQAKSGGAQISRVSITTFTGVPTSCDPYIKYDPVSNRWFYSAINCDGTPGNRMAIAVSQSSDPTGGWFKYTFVPTAPSGSFFLDHPYLGFDDRWVVVSGRKFPTGGFSGPLLILMDKTRLINNQPITFGTNAQIIEKTNADGDAPLPVTVYGTNPSPGTFYIMQHWSGANSALRLTTVTGNIPTATWNTTGASAVFPSGGSAWQSSSANMPGAEQLGETRRLAANDARISTGVMVNGNIWVAHHIGAAANNVAVQWWQINGTPGAAFGNVLQRGRIGAGLANNYRWFPGIAVNENEDVIVGYSISTNTSLVGCAYSFRSNVTPVNTTDDENIYKAGISRYYKDFGGSRARWGDYSHSALDPADGSLWTIQEYAAQRVGTADDDSRYGVWWAQVTPASTLLQRDAAIGIGIEPSGGLLCDVPVNPRIRIRNLGTDTLKSVQVGMILDGVPLGTLNSFTGLQVLTFTNSDIVSLNPSFTVAPGPHTFRVFTKNPNGGSDLRPANDTATITFTVAVPLALPYTESFQTLPFPPANGSAVINPDGPTGITWARTTVAGNPGNASMRVNCYNYQPDANGNVGQRDIYRTAKINTGNIDSLVITFNVAHQQYFGTDVTAPLNDSLNVVYSPDCGVTWLRTDYSKGSATLSTVATTSGANFIPTASQWRNERVVLKDICGKNLKSVMIGFESVNDFGNNIYVDGINIVAFNSVQNNAFLQSINQPLPALCSTTVSPEVTFSNAGQDTMRSLKINYRIDNGPINTLNWTGNLPKCGILNVNLPSISTTAGTHILTAFTSEPNGVTDQSLSNDTLKKTFSVYVPVATPVFEGFEGNSFPSDNWGVQNLNPGTSTFEKSTRAPKTGFGSMWINNPNANNVNGATDYFISPIVINSAAYDSLYVDFDFSYKSGPRYPGSTVFPLDTLEIWATKDCGATFIPVWKKYGPDLQTVNDPSYSYTAPFVPIQPAEWTTHKVYLSPFVGKTDNFQLYFVSKGNKQNNMWLDNINIRSQVLPQKLKDQGYLIYPNPFNGSFLIHHSAVEPPVDLQSAQVFNAAGQLVWDRRYNGNANRQITVDLNNLAKGIYVLKMIYTNKTVVERIVKN